MNCRRWLLFASCFAIFSGAYADPRCPGNVVSVQTRRVANYMLLVTVTLNRSASYPFLLDTGTQVTVVDPALAAELHLQPTGRATFSGVSAQQQVLMAELAELRVGERRRAHTPVAIQPLDSVQAEIPGVRGVLGGDFLHHFGVLIDQDNSLLCLDTKGDMRGKVHGERLNLEIPPADPDTVSVEPLLVPVSLSSMPERRLLLLLDSGANVPFLWKKQPLPPSEAVPSKGISSGDSLSKFISLPPQDMRIGSLLVHHITFAILALNPENAVKVQADGLLPTAQFRRVYIDYSQRYVVLEPW